MKMCMRPGKRLPVLALIYLCVCAAFNHGRTHLQLVARAFTHTSMYVQCERFYVHLWGGGARLLADPLGRSEMGCSD